MADWNRSVTATSYDDWVGFIRLSGAASLTAGHTALALECEGAVDEASGMVEAVRAERSCRRLCLLCAHSERVPRSGRAVTQKRARRCCKHSP
jgi:hypothetical protein